MKNNWKTVKVADVTDYVNRGIPPVYTQANSGTAVINQKCIRDGQINFALSRLTDESARQVPEDKLVQPYDILVNSTGTGTVGRVGQVINLTDRTTVDTHVTIIRPNKNQVDPVYLGIWLKFKQGELEDLAEGSSNQVELSRDKISNIKVVLPSLETQRKIAVILNSIDEQINETDQIIQKTEILKKGIIAKLVKNNLNSKKYKIREIAEVTSSKRVMVSDYEKEGVPFYRSTEIIKKSKNIPVREPLFISLEKFNFFKKKFGAPQSGDILITAVGTIGDVYLVQDETFYFKDGNTVWIRNIQDIILPEFLKAILSSNYYRELLNDISGGSSQKALTIQKLENVAVPIPSVLEQEEIIDILSSVDNKIVFNQKVKAGLLRLKRGLMQDIFNQKVQIN